MSPVEIILLILLAFFIVIAVIFAFLFFKSKKTADTLIKKNDGLSREKFDLKGKLSNLERAHQTLANEKIDLDRQLSALNTKLHEYTSRFQSIINADAERDRVTLETETLHQRQNEFIKQYDTDYELRKVEASQIEQKIAELRNEFALLDETSNLQSFGFYNPRYNFESSSRYQLELERLRTKQKQMISSGTAATCATEWTVNGSITEGRKQTNQTLKLILRAFNGESDAAIAKVRYNNVHIMEARINKAFDALHKLVSVQSCYISNHYLNAKLQELYLVHEHQEKLQAEKEEQRRIKEQMREEEIARREIEKALQDSEREESRYAEALRKAREEVEKAVGEKQAKFLAQIEALQLKLAEVQANKERALSRAQMTRSGHVYVISNIGSFGEGIYKIGMTRRLEPMDRVNELGDASVPFRFDVHAIIFCEDAPALENQLHKKFHASRINQVNFKKEFFRVSLDEIAAAVREFHGEIEFTKLAEAVEYRKTVAFLQQDRVNKLPEYTPESEFEDSILEI